MNLLAAYDMATLLLLDNLQTYFRTGQLSGPDSRLLADHDVQNHVVGVLHAD